MKKMIFLVLVSGLFFISCSTSENSKNDEEVSDKGCDGFEMSDTSYDEETIDNIMADSNEENDDFEENDEYSDEDSETGEFISGFDIAGKECIADIPQGRIILTTAKNYSDYDAPWRVYILILKDDGTVVDTEKYFETDPDLRGIGFNSNGRLAAVSSWKTGHVTLFALIDSTLCISDTEIVLPNLKVNGEDVERVIFDEVVPHPTDPYKMILVSGNIIETGDYNNYNGGIYTMTVDRFGKAVISEDRPQMHVPSAFTVLPGGNKAVVIGGKEFITEEGSAVGSSGPDDLALLDLTTETPQVIKWFDIWGATGVNSSSPSVKTIGVSDNGYLMIANSSEYSDDTGKIKLFQYDGNETISHVSTFSNADLDAPDYITLNDAGTTAIVLNSLFKGATLAINDGEVSYTKKETHDLTEPMIKLKTAPFADHVLIHSFRSSNDESSSITIAEITTEGLNELSSTLIPLKDDFSAQSVTVQN